MADDLQRFQYGGRERSYHIHIPENINEPVPLVLVFHGALDNAFVMEGISGFTEKAMKEKFIVVYPNGTNEYDGSTSGLTWNGGNCCGYADVEKVDDTGFVRALIEKIKKEYSVDSARIYAAGFSNGALLSYRLACNASDIFAAVAPVSGSLEPECSPKHPVAVIAFNGTADLKVLYDGGYSPVIEGSKYDTPVSFARSFWVKRNACDLQPEVERNENFIHEIYSKCKTGSGVEFYAIEGGEHEWPQSQKGLSATDLIWEFFKSHPKQKSL